jgi:hypothetical protein
MTEAPAKGLIDNAAVAPTFIRSWISEARSAVGGVGSVCTGVCQGPKWTRARQIAGLGHSLLDLHLTSNSNLQQPHAQKCDASCDLFFLDKTLDYSRILLCNLAHLTTLKTVESSTSNISK